MLEGTVAETAPAAAPKADPERDKALVARLDALRSPTVAFSGVEADDRVAAPLLMLMSGSEAVAERQWPFAVPSMPTRVSLRLGS